ncbi:selenium-binding protein SBP56-related protein [Micromonospora sp. DH15]|nr:selenium-binding protein SBP56-related protein [Micromonospora sp. DH15]
MTRWTPDPSFYPSPREAAQAPAEKLAYVAAFDRAAERPDALAVLDTDPDSPEYGRVVGWTDLPHTGDELHHFGWNACSSALCPTAPHPHVERRYLIVPGLRSSRVHVYDTKPDPRAPKLVKVIEPGELAERAGYSRPHTVHCGPDGIYLSALGGAGEPVEKAGDLAPALERAFASGVPYLVNVLTDPADAYPRSSNLA